MLNRWLEPVGSWILFETGASSFEVARQRFKFFAKNQTSMNLNGTKPKIQNVKADSPSILRVGRQASMEAD